MEKSLLLIQEAELGDDSMQADMHAQKTHHTGDAFNSITFFLYLAFY